MLAKIILAILFVIALNWANDLWMEERAGREPGHGTTRSASWAEDTRRAQEMSPPPNPGFLHPGWRLPDGRTVGESEEEARNLPRR